MNEAIKKEAEKRYPKPEGAELRVTKTLAHLQEQSRKSFLSGATFALQKQDEFDEFTIKFTEWKAYNGWYNTQCSPFLWNNGTLDEPISTKQLLEIYNIYLQKGGGI